MRLSAALREQVRHRAKFACEFCGITEIDAGGTLTIDHFQPRSKGGPDDLNNLIYACIICNQYKQDYWPKEATSPMLLNPRKTSTSQHLVEQEDGQLTGLTRIGEFTIKRLRLNRCQLFTARQRRNQQFQTQQLLQRYQEVATLQSQINTQLTDLVTEQQAMLQEQRKWLKFLLRRRGQSR